MTFVKVKTKGQMTLPASIRTQINIRAGDYLSVQVEKNKITLTPQSLIDRRLAESLEDYSKGRSYGPFATADELISSLKSHLKKGAKKNQRS